MSDRPLKVPRKNFIASMMGRPSAQNFIWLVSDRGLRLLVGIFVGSWSARYLGVSNFGLLNYAGALVAIFAGIIPLGMDALVVREIIRNESIAGSWIGTIMGFRAVTASVCALLSIGAVLLFRPGQPLLFWVVVLAATALIAQTLESGELLFQARIQMRRLIVPRLGLFLIMNVIKMGLIIKGMSVFWFAVMGACELFCSGILTYIFVRRALGRQNPLRFDFARGWHLFRDAWPLAISGLAVIIYMKVGMIIIGNLLGDAALGIYAAAIRIPESANFVPSVLATSLLPGLVKSREKGGAEYDHALLRYFRINVLIALAICIPITIAGPWIIHFLLSKTYAAASPIMMVYVWSLLFIFLGVGRGQHLLNERLTRLSLLFSLIGLTVNLTCNFLFIPIMGVMGAAIATVASQCMSSLMASFLIPPLRKVARFQCLALLTPWLAFRHAGGEKKVAA